MTTKNQLVEQFMRDACPDYPNRCWLCYAKKTCTIKYIANRMVDAGWVKDTRIRQCPIDDYLCVDATKDLKPPYSEGAKEHIEKEDKNA